MRILLVQGLPDRDLTRELERSGHDVLAVDDDRAARRLLGLFKPHVVLVTARDLARACRHLRRQAAKVPIVAIAPTRDLDARIAALESGADDCLSSPFHPAELAARMRAASRRGIPAEASAPIREDHALAGGA